MQLVEGTEQRKPSILAHGANRLRIAVGRAQRNRMEARSQRGRNAEERELRRKRAPIIIPEAKRLFHEHLETLETNERTETLDACTISFFKKVCDYMEASSTEISDFARFLAEETFWNVLWTRTSFAAEAPSTSSPPSSASSSCAPSRSSQADAEERCTAGPPSKREAPCPECRRQRCKECNLLLWQVYGPHIDAMILCSRLILSSPKTFQLNLYESSREKTLLKVRNLATANRLPLENPRTAEKLLQPPQRDYRAA